MTNKVSNHNYAHNFKGTYLLMLHGGMKFLKKVQFGEVLSTYKSIYLLSFLLILCEKPQHFLIGKEKLTLILFALNFPFLESCYFGGALQVP